MRNIAIAYSPRGFANESRVIVVPANQVAATKNEINSNTSAYVITGNRAAGIKRQWKQDIMNNGAEIETEIDFS